MKEEAPAEERLAPASHPARALRKAAAAQGSAQTGSCGSEPDAARSPAAAPAPAAHPAPPGGSPQAGSRASQGIGMAGKRLGGILLEAGVVTSAAVEQALVQQVSEGGRIGEILQKSARRERGRRAARARDSTRHPVLGRVGCQTDRTRTWPAWYHRVRQQHRLLPIRKSAPRHGGHRRTRWTWARSTTCVARWVATRSPAGPSGKIMDAVNQVYGRKQDAAPWAKERAMTRWARPRSWWTPRRQRRGPHYPLGQTR